MNSIIKDLRTHTYPCSIVICIGDRVEVRKKLKRIFNMNNGSVLIPDSAHGYTTVLRSDNGHGDIVVYLSEFNPSSSADISYWAHECFHAVCDVISIIKADVDCYGKNEHEAYLMMYLMVEGHKLAVKLNKTKESR